MLTRTNSVITAIKKLHFAFWPTLLTALMLVILITLGCWQLQRYHTKQDLLKQVAAHKHHPLNWSRLSQHPAEFTEVQVSGHLLLEKTFLLENQIQRGQGGVDVLTPLRIAGSQALVLVDRGFIANNSPDLNTAIREMRSYQYQGYVKYPPKHTVMLGDLILNPGEQPLRIQKLDLPALSTVLQEQLAPFIIRLAPDPTSLYWRDWPVTTMAPQYHLGYALQWFAMALALLILFIFFSYKKGNSHE